MAPLEAAACACHGTPLELLSFLEQGLKLSHLARFRAAVELHPEVFVPLAAWPKRRRLDEEAHRVSAPHL